MPHCIIEYNADMELQPEDLVGRTYQGALQSGLFSPEDIKVRAISYAHYSVGGLQAPFIHVTTRLLPGRTSEQKAALSNSILTQLLALELKNTTISVESIDIDAACYAKVTTTT